MLGEVSLAAGMLGKIWDMAQGKKDGGVAGQSSSEFAALLGLGGNTAADTPATTANAQSGITITSPLQASTTDSTDPATSEALNMLSDYTSGGLEGAMRAAMKKMREKVMDEMGVSDQSLAAMDPKSRMAVEDSISKEVMKRMQAAMGVQPGGAVDPTKMADFGAKLMEAAKAYKSYTPTV